MDFSSSSPRSQTQAQSQSNNGHEPHKDKPAPKSKRARPTISCLECRRKKLKCDRVQPCMQCRKSSKESMCTFAHPPVPPKAQEILQHRPAETPSKRTKLEGHCSLEVSVHPNNKFVQPLTPRDALGPVAQSEGSCGGRDEDLDFECPWLTISQQDRLPCNKVTGEKKCQGKIYIKNGRSRFLGGGDRMVILDHVNVFLHFY